MHAQRNPSHPRREFWSTLATLTAAAALSLPAYGASAFTTIHVFSGSPDGDSPRSGLVLDASGNAYGTTLYGGTSGNGTVFKLAPVAGTTSWTESVLYSFAGGSDGANPAGTLILGPGGVLYGTTIAGGGSGAGTVFELSPPTGGMTSWTETVLYSFMGGSDGGAPHAGLVRGSTGVLYGTTALGGLSTGPICSSGGCGTVFALVPGTGGGSWTEVVLHAFKGTDGANPYAGLVFGSGGKLYGNTVYGSKTASAPFTGNGVAFDLTPGGAPVYKVIHQFNGTTDGANPVATFTVSSTGILYGTTYTGGTGGDGTVFKMKPTGALALLHTFSGGSDGANPVAGVALNAAKNTLFGAASLGGSLGDGTLFSVLLKTSPVFTVLHTFDGTSQSSNPLATPTLASSFSGGTVKANSLVMGTAEPALVFDRVPNTADQGSAYSYCTLRPPTCTN